MIQLYLATFDLIDRNLVKSQYSKSIFKAFSLTKRFAKIVLIGT